MYQELAKLCHSVPDSIFSPNQSRDILVLSDIHNYVHDLANSIHMYFYVYQILHISGRYHGVFKGGVRYQSGLTAAGKKIPPTNTFLVRPACLHFGKKSGKGKEIRVCVIEKAANVGRHILSGSCHEPLALNKLILVSLS